MSHTFRKSLGLSLALASLVFAGTAHGAEWGTLKGRFVYDGKPPAPVKLNVDKDVAVCTKHHPMDETLVVAADGGLANVVVHVRTSRGTTLAIHPEYESTAADKVVLDNLYCRFEPRVVTLRTTQTLVLKNSDSVGHNTKGSCLINEEFNILIPANNSLDRKLPAAERLPFTVSCNIHPWMAGYVVVQDHPYMTVSGKDGRFEIRNLPVGEHEFQLWQEKSGYLAGVTVGGQEAPRTGRVKLTIKPGDNDLGDIKVSPSVFAK